MTLVQEEGLSPATSDLERARPASLDALAAFLPAALVVGVWVLWVPLDGGYFAEQWYPAAMGLLALLAVTVAARREWLPPGSAARLALLTPGALLSRLDDSLHVLTGGPQDQPPRLRSLDDAIAWMRAPVVPALAVDRGYAEQLQRAALELVGHRADHAAIFVFEKRAHRRGENQHRWSGMAEHQQLHVAMQRLRVPAVMTPVHGRQPHSVQARRLQFKVQSSKPGF